MSEEEFSTEKLPPEKLPEKKHPVRKWIGRTIIATSAALLSGTLAVGFAIGELWHKSREFVDAHPEEHESTIGRVWDAGKKLFNNAIEKRPDAEIQEEIIRDKAAVAASGVTSLLDLSKKTPVSRRTERTLAESMARVVMAEQAMSEDDKWPDKFKEAKTAIEEGKLPRRPGGDGSWWDKNIADHSSQPAP